MIKRRKSYCEVYVLEIKLYLYNRFETSIFSEHFIFLYGCFVLFDKLTN